jgi:hypothetical protein
MTTDVMERCEHASQLGTHLWMGYSFHQNMAAAFCCRCGKRGYFSTVELERWANERESRWQELLKKTVAP